MSRLTNFLLVLLLFGAIQVPGILIGQKHNPDSLYSIWMDESANDSLRTVAYFDYIKNGFLESQPDTAVLMAEGLIAFGYNEKYDRAAGLGYEIQGTASMRMGEYHDALKYFGKSLSIWEQINNQQEQANSLNNLGNASQRQGNYKKALEFFRRTLEIYNRTDDKIGIASSLNNMGITYLQQGNYVKSLINFNKSLEIQKSIGDSKVIAPTLVNLGRIYFYQDQYDKALDHIERGLSLHQGNGYEVGVSYCEYLLAHIYYETGNNPKALEHLNNASQISTRVGNRHGMANNLDFFGTIYQDQGDYAKALDYFNRSLEIKFELGIQREIAETLVKIGRIHYQHADFTNAIDFCSRALGIADSLETMEYQKKSCQCLYDAYNSLGYDKSALIFLNRILIINDSLNQQEISKSLQQMEFERQLYRDSVINYQNNLQSELDHKEEVRKERQNRNVAYIGGLLALIFAGGLYSRWRYIRKSNRIISQEKERSENLLHNILPEDVAAELIEHGRSEAREFDEVTVLFTDFVGFTDTAAVLSAKELVSEINTCFKAFDEIIYKYQIEKIKTIGDAYMAAGGLHIPRTSKPRDVVQAALEMQYFIEVRHKTREASGQPAFQMRVGIHTGAVVAGIVGVRKFQYDIWGDTVNTAARMESHGEIGKVNISEATYELVKDELEFEFEHRGVLEVKGKGDMRMYFVSGG